MTRIRSLGALAAVVAVACSACMAVGSEGQPQSADFRTITTTANATAKAAPDRARFVIEVETRDAVAERCAQRNAKVTDSVVAALKGLVGRSGTVTTDLYSLAPRYSTENQGGVRRQVLDGYAAKHRLKVNTQDLDSVGALLDTAVDSGATGAGAIEFYVEDTDSLRREALSEAGARAKADAATIAESLGVSLGDLLSASQGGGSVVTPRPFGRMIEHASLTADAPTPTPVEPGDVELMVTVTTVFEVE